MIIALQPSPRVFRLDKMKLANQQDIASLVIYMGPPLGFNKRDRGAQTILIVSILLMTCGLKGRRFTIKPKQSPTSSQRNKCKFQL